MDEDEAGRSAEELARRLIGEFSKQAEFGSRVSKAPKPERKPERFRWSGPGPDVRDPQTFSDLCGQLQKKETWSAKLAQGKIFAAWPTIVGEQIASHATPVQLSEGLLHVQAESTAWATQLRLMQSQLLEKFSHHVGKNVVRGLKITGPKAPSWRKGERHVRGRGPRDTYG
ncbi:MAG: DciA family protein [Segniliparus sp.]|uniref:DciA family protein n=1 Tax=Segniliparus sp. TaxID=2804064 RepID=UPI003F3E9E74